MSALLDFVLTLDRLKNVERRNSVAGAARFENTAEHSWHAATMALVLREACAFPVDAHRASRMLLLHDVPEIECGDTFLYDAARADASQFEALALDKLLAGLPAGTPRKAAQSVPSLRKITFSISLLPHRLSRRLIGPF